MESIFLEIVVNRWIRRMGLWLCCLISIPGSIWAQEKTANWAIGPEIQQYPTGYILGLHANSEFPNQWNLEIRAGYNIVRHQNFGVHEEETGGGWGGTIGTHYRWVRENTQPGQGWIIGARSDLWINTIDWKDNIGTPAEQIGQTRALVLQPTAIAGYQFLLGEKLYLIPTLGFGMEINLVEDGGEVGEGAILLWGVRLLIGS